jgi:hypothetical protein
MGAVTDFFLGGSLAPLGVTVSFVSAAAADELDRLLNWRKSLGQQLEITRRELPSALTPLIHRR